MRIISIYGLTLSTVPNRYSTGARSPTPACGSSLSCSSCRFSSLPAHTRDWPQSGLDRVRSAVCHGSNLCHAYRRGRLGDGLKGIYDTHTAVVGTESGTAFITDPSEVTAYDRRLAELEQVAVFGDEATQVFTRVADDYRDLA